MINIKRKVGNQKLVVSINDPTGRLLRQLESFEQEIKIDISDLPLGILFLTIINEEGNHISKIIKE